MKVLGEVDIESGVPAHTVVWRDLVAAALLGTDRREWTPLATGTGLDSLLADLPADSPAGAVLGAAGALALYRHAGEMAATNERPMPAAAPDDDLPRCGRKATALLSRMLGGEQRELLDEWLSLCAAAGQRAPEEQLETLLDYGRSNTEARANVTAAIGGRGRWLASHNKAWHYAIAGSDDEILEGDNPAARAEVIKRIRASDPVRAREKIAASLKGENPETRAMFISILADGLSMDDEPFLEQQLDDRAGDVRETAADLLAHLSASRLVERMTARVAPVLSFKRSEKRILGVKVNSSATIDVVSPEHPDKVAERDGILGGSPSHAQWTKMVSALPPQHWTKLWSVTAAEIVAATAKNEWRDSLLHAWAKATVRYNDQAWAEALLGPDVRFSYPRSEEVLAVLPASRREQIALEWLRGADRKTLENNATAEMLSYCQPWSLALSRAVLAMLRQVFAATDTSNYWRIIQDISRLAHQMPAEMIAEVDFPHQTGDGGRHINAVMDSFGATLSFRNEMRRAFEPQNRD